MTLHEVQHASSIAVSSFIAAIKSFFIAEITLQAVGDTLFYSALGATVGYILPLIFKFLERIVRNSKTKK